MWWQQEWQKGLSKAVPAAFPSSCIPVLWHHAPCAWPSRGMASGPSCSVLGQCTGQAELRKEPGEKQHCRGFSSSSTTHRFFFHSAECHHSPWVSQKLGEWARKELYHDVCSPVGLGWCAGGFVGRESCPRQLLVRLTVSERCCWGLTDGNDCAIGADPCIFNL